MTYVLRYQYQLSIRILILHNKYVINKKILNIGMYTYKTKVYIVMWKNTIIPVVLPTLINKD